MKKKSIIYILIMPFVIMITLFLSSCNGLNSVSEIRMKDSSVIEISAGDFTYEGKKVILVYSDGSEKEIDLTKEMIPEVERLKFFKMGEQEIKVEYTSRLTTTMKINVTRRDFEDMYALEGYTCTYDGLPHKVDLNYELPEGATVDYIYGNSFTNAGEYDVVGVISKDGYNPKTISTKLIIEKAEYDTNSIEFKDLAVAYDGSPKKLLATNVPEGVNVSYDIYNEDGSMRINNAVNAGKYKVVAKFSDTDKNHKKINNMEATLTINKAKYDMSNVSIDDVTKTYDGLEYEPKLASGSILPEGVSVEFKCYNEAGELVNSNANAGTYKIVASFKGNTTNYEEITPIESKLIVEKKVVSISNLVSFDSMTVNYDGNSHSLKVSGTLPTGVSVVYRCNGQDYNDEFSQIDAKEYTVTARFNIDNTNERLDIESLTAYLIINKIEGNVLVYDSTTQTEREILTKDLYFEVVDGNKVLKIKGLDTSEFKISITRFYDLDTKELVSPNDFINGAQYSYEINIVYVDQALNGNITLSPILGVMTYTNA